MHRVKGLEFDRLVIAGVHHGVVPLAVGELRSEDVGVLNSEYRELTGTVALELSQLQTADATGVAALLEIASLGAELRGVSGYVKLLLSQRGRDHPDT